ncbi:catalase [Klebsiella michiganensis]|nr:catalase [Klebsiella michiganensis]
MEAMDLLQPLADGFRNYRRVGGGISTETLLIDKAQQLTLTAPEMTVLVAVCACWARTSTAADTACLPTAWGC